MRTLVLLIVAAVGFARSAAGEQVFGSFAYQVGSGPQSVASGDLNCDGHPDLVAANRYTDDVSVLLNLGDGTYAEHVIYDMGNEPTWVGLADLDDDDVLDVITTNAGSGDVAVRFNDGTGVLGPVAATPLGMSPSSATLADLDGDQYVDIAVTSFAGGGDPVVLLLNDGTGALAVATPLSGDFLDGPISIAAGDLDGDDDQDLVIHSVCDPFGCGGGPIGLFFNNGDATFIEDAPYPGGIPVPVDFENDGDLDIYVVSQMYYGGSILSTMTNDGRGGFDVAEVVWFPAASPRCIDAGDLNGDGLADAVVPDAGTSTCEPLPLYVISHPGGGTWEYVPHTAGPEPVSVVLADVDADGDLDAAASHGTQEYGTPYGFCFFGDVTVFLNDGHGRLGTSRHLGPAGLMRAIGVADFDQDPGATLDIVAIDADSSDVLLWTDAGDGTYGDAVAFPVGNGPFSMDIGDLDGDERPDVVTADLAGDTVSVLINTGGSFTASVQYPVPDRPGSISLGDIDADDDVDIVCGHNSSPGNVSVLRNDGSGVFTADPTLPTSAAPPGSTMADLDGDDDLDVAFADAFSGAAVLINDGTGTFTETGPWPTGLFSIAIDGGDLDGDGDVDLAVTNFNDASLSVLLNDGDADFSDTTNYAVGESPRSVKLVDLDGDGDRDAIVSVSGDAYGNPNCITGEVVVLLNEGDGTLVEVSRHRAGDGPTSLASADLDGAGRPELIVGNSANPFCFFDQGVTILRNLLPPCSGDTNGDGEVDVDDLVNVIVDWGTDGSASGGDLTGALPGSLPDGIVDVNDLNAVIVGWGAC